MGAGAALGRAGGLAVALGIGWAVLSGVGCAVASAEPTAGASGHASSAAVKNKHAVHSPRAAVNKSNTAARPTAVSRPVRAVKAQAAVQNTLTYTPGPTIIDQITVLGLRVLRQVSNVIGVDLFAQANSLLITPSPPPFLTFGEKTKLVDYTGTGYDGDPYAMKAYVFTPPHPTGKVVVAIHGSGFVYQPNIMQWYDYTTMARDTGATVVVPLYPLATTEAGAAVNAVPEMAAFLSDRIAETGPGDLSVYADSAGSMLAIAAVRQMILNNQTLPASMVLLSLTVDGSLTNPAIKTIDDPVIDPNNLGSYNSHWGDGLTPKDPYINALYFEDDVLTALPPTTIYVGSLEFNLPDTLLLHDRAVAEGSPISVVVGRGQIHDWALGVPINSQALAVRGAVYRQLGLFSGS